MTSPRTVPATTPSTRTCISARWLKKRMHQQLATLKKGHLRIFCDSEWHSFGQQNSALQAELTIHHDEFWWLVATNGSIGAAEAYIQGHWETPELTNVVQVFVANLEVLDQLEGGIAVFSQWLLKGLHWLNRNNRQGSKRNIAAHYDLGNSLFERMLDPSMMYSAAMFERPTDSLYSAQLNKLKRICEKLELTPEDHLLEIGTGWGGMALYAAREIGCRVTTTTLSREQYAYTQRKIEAMGLTDRVTLLLEDYRDLTGQYDKIVSIEMIEAVGHRYLPDYFRQCATLLKEDGLMLLQAITIRDQRYAKAKASVDFIQRYIFPGGALPSMTVLLDTLTTHTDLNLAHMEDFGLHYARTLRHWHHNLVENRSALETLGYDEAFFRLWQFYLCYCEGGFLQRAIDTAQLLLAKPEARPRTFGLEA